MNETQSLLMLLQAGPQSLRDWKDDEHPNTPAIDRLKISGFVNIAKHLDVIYQSDDVVFLLNGKRFELDTNEWTESTPGNPVFSYSNEYIPGWRREVSIRMGGKSQGTVDTSYIHSGFTRRIKNKAELTACLLNNSSLFSNPEEVVFDFRHPHCICHDQSSSGKFVECCFGLAGCNRWVHTSCVGLEFTSDEQLALLPPLVCPLCTHYLEGAGQSEFLHDKM